MKPLQILGGFLAGLVLAIKRTLALFLYGTGLGAYFLLWIFVPQRPAEAPPLSNP